MKRPNSYGIAALLAATLAAPAVIVAAPAAQDDRVYDRDHKDYHHWDDHENQAWHSYLAEQHRKEYEFAKANKKEQEAYWNWRHSHPD